MLYCKIQKKNILLNREKNMFNRRIEITKENESILFINAVIENLRYAIISLDEIFYKKDYSGYYDEHTFYFFLHPKHIDGAREYL